MGLYSKHIYPHIIEYILSNPSVTRYRKEALAHVKGDILEIGFGTGLSLPCYPAFVKEITAIDTNEGMNVIASKRASQLGIKVNIKTLNAEVLSFDNNSFDSIVSTFTFCSIGNTDAALKEFCRVLKPDGRLVFLEHGLSTDPKVINWQNRLNPVYLLTSDGCNLNRDIKNIIERNKFKITQLEQFYCEHMLKIMGYYFKGVAVKEIDL